MTQRSVLVGRRKESTSCAKPLAGVSALVLDDDADARELLATELDRRGATTKIVGSVEEAVQALATFPYDLLVSDIGMPIEDGYSLARRLRLSHDRPYVVLALTSQSTNEDRQAAMAAGFDGHVTKPFHPDSLVAEVTALLRNAAGSTLSRP